MGKLIDETGNIYGLLTVLNREGTSPSGKPIWICKCKCGQTRSFVINNLRRGDTKSCGCMQKETSRERMTTHGKYKHELHGTWINMIARCENPNLPQFKDYGGRGISVCDRWRKSFANFLEDMGERPSGTSLDRVDNDAGYSRDNCRWASKFTQIHNSRVTKLNAVAVDVIRYLHRKGASISKLANAHNVSRGCIKAVVTGQSWRNA